MSQENQREFNLSSSEESNVTITLSNELVSKLEQIKKFDPNVSGNSATENVRFARKAISELFLLNPKDKYIQTLEEERDAFRGDFEAIQKRMTKLQEDFNSL